MDNSYQEHRSACLAVFGDALTRYRDDIGAGLSTDGELFDAFASALEEKGPVRLFKYQPFSERNLQDCEAGVLHLSKLDDLNDINEGLPIFGKSKVERELSSVDVEQVKAVDTASLPPFIRDMIGDAGLQQIIKTLKQARESGALENAIAPGIASELQKLFIGRRDFALCGSLSETERSASMWDRYGNGHHGFAVGYTIDTFVTDYSATRTGACTHGFKALLAPVFYGERYDVSLYSSAAAVRDPSTAAATNMEVLYLALLLLQKAKEWEHEQEWRIITYACPAGPKVHYCKMKPDSIYLGLRMQQDERNRAIEVARRNGWRVFEMKLSQTSLDWTLDAEEMAEG